MKSQSKIKGVNVQPEGAQLTCNVGIEDITSTAFMRTAINCVFQIFVACSLLFSVFVRKKDVNGETNRIPYYLLG